LAALPGMVKALLESGKLAKPGNSYMMVNPLGSQLQFLRTRVAATKVIAASRCQR
jgi:hypothetical protein